MEFSQARQAFLQEVRLPIEQIDLARAALYLAQEDYPGLAVESYLNQLDQMAAVVGDRLAGDRVPMRVIRAINQYLFTELEFSGNQADYYDPRNSFFNEVLDRRLGIPITLSLVYLEVAKRLNFPMVGIGMPGHFIIRPDFEEAGIFVDAFAQGEILFPQDCADRLSSIYGQPVALKPQFLEPVDPHRFLVRMLTNLKAIYISQQDPIRAARVIEQILLIFPDAIQERRDRGLLYYQLERFTEARADLQAYLEAKPQAFDRAPIAALLDRLSDF
jgi:regulator of sirC expression with transglutaminase-like and TPR domain